MSGPRRARAPESVDAALAQSARHLRNALAEALLAAHALLDAVSLALTGHATGAPDDAASPFEAALAALARRVEDVAASIRADDARLPDSLARAVLAALDGEIARWQERSRDDRDARAVLRAFLGLREILWEFGLRGGVPSARATAEPTHANDEPARAAQDHERATNEPAQDAPPATATPSREVSARRTRVQRIDVEG